MAQDTFSRLLASRDWLLADGATGTNLFNMGLTATEPPELWNASHPAQIRQLYRSAVEAGADLFLTNTFGGNAARLQLQGVTGRVGELNRLGAALGRDIADAAGRPVVVAGSMGPTGSIFEPMGPMTQALAIEIAEEQAAALKEGGADLLWFETLTAPEEFRVAADVAARVGLPWAGSMSFDTAGRSMMGVTTTALAALVARLPLPPLAFGANCGLGVSDLVRSVTSLAKTAPHLPIIAKGNAGIPQYHQGHIHYDGTPALMADYAVMARDAGARVIGGCCGTMAQHLSAMRDALETRPKAPAPGLAEIEARLGAFSSRSDGTESEPCPDQGRGKRGRS